MKGHSIAGMSTTRERIKDDFYATPPESTRALLNVEELVYPILEPACGAGHIVKELGAFHKVFATDLVDRGCGETGVDFLTYDFSELGEINTIITNPPFSLFQGFAERGLEIARRKVILFGKLQALEGKKRATFMQNSPLRTVYVFKSRQNPLRNGSPLDENGKPWASTMAFAWFVWEIGYNGKPQIEWI